MWLLLQSWLLRNVLTLLGWFATAAAVAAVLFGARQAGRDAERVERMQRIVEVQHDQLEATSVSRGCPRQGRPRRLALGGKPA
jgi:hypothetical protein